MSVEYEQPEDVTDETTVVIARSAAKCFHRPKESEQVEPACNVEGHPPSKWRFKKYSIIKGFWRPCQKNNCYGDAQ